MKTIHYPPQHITEVGDILYNSPKPERVIICSTYLAGDIYARLDEETKYFLELIEGDLTLNVDFKCEWDEAPCIYDIEINAFFGDRMDPIEHEIDLQDLVDEVYRLYV